MEFFKSPMGNKLSCKGWRQEGLLRLLLNCLDSDIAKMPQNSSLNALLNCSSGADLVGLYHGGGVGIGYSMHSGLTLIADGTDEAKKRLNLVLKADPNLGVIRYAEAGYEKTKAIVENSIFPSKVMG